MKRDEGSEVSGGVLMSCISRGEDIGNVLPVDQSVAIRRMDLLYLVFTI